MAKIKVDGKDYDTDHISDQAKSALGAMQFTDGEIKRIQATLAAMQTARMVYANRLKQALEAAPQGNTSTSTGFFSSETIQFK